MSNAQKQIAKVRKSRRVDADTGSLEECVVALARDGRFANAARRAVRAQVAKGIAVTFKRGKKIIKRYSDGREEVLASVQRPPYTLPAGVGILGKK
jgi:hypothetical protein